MYSPSIVEKTLWQLARNKIVVKRRDVAQCREISARLRSLVDPKSGHYRRPLVEGETAFIRSETILCRHDFRYFAERYGNIDQDAAMGGGVSPVTFWTSQDRALSIIAAREEEVARQFAKSGFSDGILTVWHKSRQLGATAIMRLITLHRMLLWKHMRCIAGSLDIDKVHELYVRDKTIIDNLPPFLVPAIEFDVKDSHISFENLKSRLIYQMSSQKAGVGTGQQFDLSHMTEVALWEYAERLKFDFLPTIPQAPSTFVAFESTANGRGNFWHDFSENVRNKLEGYQSWTYIFTPWYIESRKYRRSAPDDWRPNTATVEHAQLVKRTSPEFCGTPIALNRDQMYWYETEYAMHKKEGSLYIFLSNFCATPEQSFQHSTRPALPPETIEWMRSTSQLGMPYNVELVRSRV